MKHSEEDDIVQGWKEYFHKMNEEDTTCDLEESEEDENHMTRRLEGKPGALAFTAEEYTAWCLPWMNSLIIKVLGASFPTYIIRDRINRMWRPKDPLKLIPLNNGYYIVSFSNKEDKEYAFQEGPWMIEDHYLIVQRWRPNFNHWKADLQCNIAAWVRLPDVPFEFYNVESLRRIGNMIGKMIKVDRPTSIYEKGGFARICVELDLKQPLLPTYVVFGEERPIIYKGLHQVCFECGKYGHQNTGFPLRKKDDPAEINEKEEPKAKVCTGVKGGETSEKEARTGSGSTIVTATGEDNESPFGKLRMLRRDFRGPIVSGTVRKESDGKTNQSKSQDIFGNKKECQRMTVMEEVQLRNKDIKDIKREVVKERDPPKSEWVKVGSKRKSASKGRAKGKENMPPARDRASRHSRLGLALETNELNPPKSLQGLDYNLRDQYLVHGERSTSRLGVDSSIIITHSEVAMQEPLCVPTLEKQVDMDVGLLKQDHELMQKTTLDEHMRDQDKTDGESAISQHTPTVSQ
ncbi:hypothetical protein K1719_033351 [Acacia pycnantha]|nr:hypothetical protein K1719_033351 [Acacia pycnantha]